MKRLKMPNAWLGTTQAQPTPSINKSEVKADAQKVVATQPVGRIDMSEEVVGAGLCPDCRRKMEPYIAGGIPVVACMSCRITLPTSDDGSSGMDNLDLSPFC